MNKSKLPSREIGKSREIQMKEIDQAGSKFGSTVLENNRWKKKRQLWSRMVEVKEGKMQK